MVESVATHVDVDARGFIIAATHGNEGAASEGNASVDRREDNVQQVQHLDTNGRGGLKTRKGKLAEGNSNGRNAYEDDAGAGSSYLGIGTDGRADVGGGGGGKKRHGNDGCKGSEAGEHLENVRSQEETEVVEQGKMLFD